MFFLLLFVFVILFSIPISQIKTNEESVFRSFGMTMTYDLKINVKQKTNRNDEKKTAQMLPLRIWRKIELCISRFKNRSQTYTRVKIDELTLLDSFEKLSSILYAELRQIRGICPLAICRSRLTLMQTIAYWTAWRFDFHSSINWICLNQLSWWFTWTVVNFLNYYIFSQCKKRTLKYTTTKPNFSKRIETKQIFLFTIIILLLPQFLFGWDESILLT